MLKENDRIAWRYEGNKGYSEGFVKEVNGKMIRIANSLIERAEWFNGEEIEIEILNRTNRKN